MSPKTVRGVGKVPQESINAADARECQDKIPGIFSYSVREKDLHRVFTL